MRIEQLILRAGIILILVSISRSPIEAQPKPEVKISEKTEIEVLKIFSTKGLWTEEFPAVLSSLTSWKGIDQTRISVFRDKVVGNRKYRNDESAGNAASKLESVIKESKPEFSERSLKFGLRYKDPKELTEVNVVRFFGDDDSTRVALKLRDTKHQLFRKDLRMEEVRGLLGAPQEIQKQEMRKEDGDGRPVILTLYRYADGLVIFAESDFAAKPGTVNRLILNVPAISQVLFKER